jgi:MFS family permease
VLTYVSLGADLGWLSGSMVALLVAGVAALAGWVVVALRVTDPIVDVRLLRGPIALTLLVVVLGAGSYQSVLQLVSLIAQVPPGLGLGYGLGGAEESVGMLFSAPALGVLVGGIGAGWLATRIGPELTLLGGVAAGTVATFLLLGAVSSLPAAMVCVVLLGSAVGSLVASGFNLAISVAPEEKTGTVSGLVTIMLAFGSVVLNVAGNSLLMTTATPVDGVPRNSLGGVYGYIVMAGALFLVATVVAAVIVRRRRRVPRPVEVASPSPA